MFIDLAICFNRQIQAFITVNITVKNGSFPTMALIYTLFLLKSWASFNNGSDSTVGRNSPLREVCSQQSLIGYFLSLDLRWPLYFIRMHQEATTRRYYGLQSSVLCGSSCSNLLSISSSLTALVKFGSSGFNYGRSQITTKRRVLEELLLR